MKELPTWLRPQRWLAFFLTLLGVCSFLAIIPVGPESALPPEAPAAPLANQDWSFIDYLREGAREVQVEGHWTALLPPLIAVMVAAFFRSMPGALIAAFAVGSFLSYGLNPLATAVLGVNDFLVRPALSQFSALVILFLFALVGMAHVMWRSGGLDGLVNQLQRLAKGRRQAKIAIGLSGLLVFFDAHANAVLVGASMQRLSDRLRISREKLAYLVDSTAAPVAGLALLSTWVAFEVYLLGDVASAEGVGLSGYGMLVEMLPLRFYCIGTLVFVFLTSAMGRDFGPMAAAERRALRDGKVIGDGHEMIGLQPSPLEIAEPPPPPRWYNAAAPILIVLLLSVLGILLLGAVRLESAGGDFSMTRASDWRAAFAATVFDPLSLRGAGAMPVLLVAALVGGMVAVALPVAQGVLKVGTALSSYVRGLPTMWMAVFILAMTWSMREICDTLGTAEYLIAMLGGGFPVWMLPLLSFLVAAALSFTTGSSWGAMGILIPVMMPLAVKMGALQPEFVIVYLLTAAAVLDGAIFGDHCSPISDTTVLSSISTGCDHIAHVHTQLYYAAVTVLFACVFGYASVAQGMPVWTFYLLYPLAVAGFLWFFGKRADLVEPGVEEAHA